MSNLSEVEKEDIRLRYLKVDSSNVADVLDDLGLPNQGVDPSFVPLPASAGQLAGWAFTIRGQMVAYEHANGDPEKMKACEQLKPGMISVWSGDGAGICFFGELIALGMKERGCVGALVDGGIRDVRWLGEHRFPVYARYRTAVQSIGRWRVSGRQEPIYLRGATSERVVVHPGDFVLCDEDGGIVIPARHVTEVLDRSEELTRKEALIREAIARGMTLRQALDEFGHV